MVVHELDTVHFFLGLTNSGSRGDGPRRCEIVIPGPARTPHGRTARYGAERARWALLNLSTPLRRYKLSPKTLAAFLLLPTPRGASFSSLPLSPRRRRQRLLHHRLSSDTGKLRIPSAAASAAPRPPSSRLSRCLGGVVGVLTRSCYGWGFCRQVRRRRCWCCSRRPRGSPSSRCWTRGSSAKSRYWLQLRLSLYLRSSVYV